MTSEDFSRAGGAKVKSFEEFWPFYVHEHLVLKNRRLHFVGTCLSIISLVVAAVTGVPWFLLAALISGYGFAWYGHFFVERNRPATLKYPLYSLLGDFRMFYFVMNGKMEQEIDRLSPRWSHPRVEAQ